MLKTSIWQWILEMFFLVFFNIFIYLFHGQSKLMDRYLLTINISFTILLNGFYLLGDRTFQTNYHSKGFIQALWLALLQS